MLPTQQNQIRQVKAGVTMVINGKISAVSKQVLGDISHKGDISGDVSKAENIYVKEVSFDNPYIRHQTFEDIETGKIHTAYADKYVQEKMREESKYYNLAETSLSDYCHKKDGRYLISEIKDKFIVLNPYNSSKNNNGFEEVQRDFFMSAIESGQPKAKKLVLSKYPQMR